MSCRLQIVLCLSGMTLWAGFAHAQTHTAQSEYVSVQSSYNCARGSTEHNKGIIQGIKNSARETKSRSRKEALAAARDAVARGYNYALMRPWNRRDYTKVVVSEGVWFDFTTELKQSQFTLGCKAMPDDAAYDWMWGERAAGLEASSEVALIDLRELIKTLDPKDSMKNYRVRKAAVFEEAFERPGDREAFIKQIAVKQAAADCFKHLGPVSATQFKQHVSAQDRDAREACIQSLNAQARAVGWSDHPGLVNIRAATLSNSGYTVNRPTKVDANNPSSLPENLWGKGWSDLSASYPNFDGVFIASEGGAVLIASNTMPQSALLDHAVYYAAKSNMQSYPSGIRVTDKTEFYRDRFDKAVAKRNEKIQKDRLSAQRNGSSADEKIERLTRDISREEDRIRRAEKSMQIIHANKSEIPQYDLIIQRHEQETQRRTEKIAQYRSEIAELQSPSASTHKATPSRPMPSQQTSGADYQGAYYAFEQNYKNILIFREGGIGGSCSEDDLVCADKLQAYNVLGPRLNVVGHEMFTPPVGYKPYTPSQ